MSLIDLASRPSRRYRLLTAVPALLLLAALPACRSDRRPESPAQAQQTVPPAFQAERLRLVHAVHLPPAAKRLSAAERQRFDDFIAQAAGGNLQAVHLYVLSADGRGTDVLRRAAIEQGVDPVKVVSREPGRAVPAGLPRPAPGWLTLVAERYVALPPSCPRLSHIEEDDNSNEISTNFGCAQVSVFEAQVVDPRDLVLGESGGETDSQLTSAAIERLRNDKLKSLGGAGDFTPNSGGSSDQGGGGGGSGSGGGAGGGGSTGSGS